MDFFSDRGSIPLISTNKTPVELRFYGGFSVLGTHKGTHILFGLWLFKKFFKYVI